MNKDQTQKYFDLLEKVKSHCAILIYNLDEAGIDQVTEMDGE